MVTGDVLNIIACPLQHSFREMHWNVEQPGPAGLTFSLALGALPIIAATPGDVNSWALVTTPAAGTWPLFLENTNEILSLTFDNIPAEGLGNFRLRVTPILRTYHSGEY